VTRSSRRSTSDNGVSVRLAWNDAPLQFDRRGSGDLPGLPGLHIPDQPGVAGLDVFRVDLKDSIFFP